MIVCNRFFNYLSNFVSYLNFYSVIIRGRRLEKERRCNNDYIMSRGYDERKRERERIFKKRYQLDCS